MRIPEAVLVSLATADRVVARMEAGARAGREIHADEVHHLVQAYVYLLSVLSVLAAAGRVGPDPVLEPGDLAPGK